jgi:nucleobase:cation symporter-1, NCS1 family
MYNGEKEGIYWYGNNFGINWRAYTSFFVAVGPLLPGFSKSINNTLDVGGAWKIYTFSCLYGFVVSGLVYYLLCTYVSGVGAAKIDEAVYPPGKFGQNDVESGVAPSDDVSIEEKNGIAVSIGQKGDL